MDPTQPSDTSGDLAQESLQLEERIRVVMATRRLDESVAGGHTLPELLRIMSDTVLQDAGADAWRLLLFNPTSDELFLKAARRRQETELSFFRVPTASPLRLPLADSVPGRTLRDRRTTRITDAAERDDLPEGLAPDGARFLICLPLAVDDEALGVLTVSKSAGAFSDGDELLLAAVCERLADVLRDLQIVEDAQEVDAFVHEEVGRATSQQRRLNEELREEISQRRRTEAELRAQTVTLQELVAHLPEGVCLLDEAGTVVMANSLAYEHLQVLTGQNLSPGSGMPRLGPQEIEPGQLADNEGHEIIVEGPPRQVFVLSARPITQGVMAGRRLLVLQDVTLERESRDQIRQQDRLAAVGQLAAGIAHDFNNVLTSVIGLTDLIRLRDDLPGETVEDLGRIAAQGRRAAEMTRQILDFSRGTVVRRHPLGMRAFLHETMKVLERTLPETIRMTVDVGSEECLVDADLTQMQQVLTNLVLNASDAMPEGGDLGVNCVPLPGTKPPAADLPAGEWVALSVTDTGCGIPREAREHIFEPFFTTKEPGKGTGLGLAQVYGIVQEHGGTILVDSDVDQGTTCRIYLPRLTEQVPEEQKPDNSLVLGTGETILVVEDQEAVRELAQAMLKALNYQVLVAANGKAALELYEEHAGGIDLVLTDEVMPVMGGSELIQELRRRDPAVRAVLMTGYPLTDRVEAVRAADVPILEKPLPLHRLGRVLRDALA